MLAADFKITFDRKELDLIEDVLNARRPKADLRLLDPKDG